MRILISGASGLIGSALAQILRDNGHSVCRLVRTNTPVFEGDICWDPARGHLNASDLEGFNAVVHLAGENIAAGRWTARRKPAIRTSRVDSTALLASVVAGLNTPPTALICASAIGFYGDRDTERLTEDSAAGHGFLSDLCREWESASQQAASYRTRVVNLRFGVVLTSRGGALARMLGPFRKGLGGVIDGGQQYMSWIALEDALAVIQFAIENPNLQGPVNAVAPHPVTNAEFTHALAKALSRSARFPLPAFLVKVLFGEMGEALLLSSLRVFPKRLMDAGYRFYFPRVETALEHAITGKARENGPIATERRGES